MFAPPVLQVLSGDRLHLSHGPIDIVLKAWGDATAVKAAYAAAWNRFPRILPELCDELAALRTPVAAQPALASPVARRMLAACRPFSDVFVTPMAAVAGAVADELLAELLAAAPLTRAFVNDGGDIAVHVAAGASLEIGLAGDFRDGAIPLVNGQVRIGPADGIGGIATSGARGRSFSLGIADTVTTLAHDAATADVAATLIANAVDLASPLIVRRPAREIDPDSDLVSRLVTMSVGRLAPTEIADALARGWAQAETYRAAGLVAGAALMLQGASRVSGMAARAMLPAPEAATGDMPAHVSMQSDTARTTGQGVRT